MGASTAPAGGNSAMDEDDVQEIGDEEKEKLIDLDYLTGNPLPSDILLYAVPVCAPYNALQTYKYRVKITPGTAKKGKGMSGYELYLASHFAFHVFSPDITLIPEFVTFSCQNRYELVPAHS